MMGFRSEGSTFKGKNLLLEDLILSFETLPPTEKEEKDRVVSHESVYFMVLIKSVFYFRSSEEVFSCFQRHTEACTSVVMALAQHQMEWLLLECPLNKTLVSYDILHGVSSCSLKLGYNLYNGLQVSSDFVGVLCAAEELYQICLSTESVPQMAQLYMQPGRDAMTLFQQKKCYNGTDETSLLFNFEGRCIDIYWNSTKGIF